MFANLLSLAALVAVANAEHWIFGGSRPIVTTRLDPIVNPDGVRHFVVFDRLLALSLVRRA